MHTPKKTKRWEENCKWQSITHRPAKPLEGPLVVELFFAMPRPKSLPKKVIYHTKKPDVDNLQKSVIDALANAAIFKNDSQIVYKTATKYYSDRPGVKVVIREYDEERYCLHE